MISVEHHIVDQVHHEVCGQRHFVFDPPVECRACAAYVTVRSGTPLGLDEFRDLQGQAGRTHDAALLYEAYVQSVVDDTTVQALVGPSWCSVEFPDRSLAWEDWREMFDLAGFTVDGVPSMRPTKTLRLYRAASNETRGGHSWTSDIGVAESFLDLGGRHLFDPLVWEADVTPDRLLAQLVTVRPCENQFVVETAGLEIRKREIL